MGKWRVRVDLDTDKEQVGSIVAEFVEEDGTISFTYSQRLDAKVAGNVAAFARVAEETRKQTAERAVRAMAIAAKATDALNKALTATEVTR